MTTKTFLSSKKIEKELEFQNVKVQSFSNTKTTIYKKSFDEDEWKDILEELSNPRIVRDVIQARKEFKERKTIPYNKALEQKQCMR